MAGRIDFEKPHSARVWNYWMGGKDYYPVDKEAGDAVIAHYPDIVTLARQSRQFLIRVVRYLAGEAGMRQFLDIGTGLPTVQNTHEVAQAIAPESRVVYVDNDPMVLAHARALLTNTTDEGVTTYVDADVRDPELIVSDARNVLNFTEPVAVMFMGILGMVPDFDEVRSIIGRVMSSVPSGSYLALYDGTNSDEAHDDATVRYNETTANPYHLRSPDRLARCFDGLELVPPGVVSLTAWRRDAVEVGSFPPVDAHGGVARKA